MDRVLRRASPVLALVALGIAVGGSAPAVAAPPTKKALTVAAFNKYLKKVGPVVVSANNQRRSVRMVLVSFTSSTTNGVGAIPGLNKVGEACDKVSPTIEDMLLAVPVPATVRADHRKMVRSFSNFAARCADISASARRMSAAWDEAYAKYQAGGGYLDVLQVANELTALITSDIQPFAQGMGTYAEAGLDWRFSVTQYGATLGVRVPAWVKSIGK